MKWIGPIQIDELLDNVIDSSIPMPPESNSVYLITKEKWEENPITAQPLYVGSITSESKRFKVRIGDLIADMFGFYNDFRNMGHHSGGQTLHKYCKAEKINPKRLFIGWVTDIKCGLCSERELYNKLKPKLNKKVPQYCKRNHD